MERKYYLAIFSQKSWDEFIDHGCRIYGTTKNKMNRAKKIHEGNYLICYVAGESKFSGLLEISSDAFLDKQEIWSQSTFPIRFDVEPHHILMLKNAIPAQKLKDELDIFKNLKNIKRWSGFFMNAFSEFSKKDGAFLHNLIKQEWVKQNINN
jgi:predicted RNA-binding protein